MDPKDVARQKIREYLDRNRVRLVLMSSGYIVVEVRTMVMESLVLSADEVGSIVFLWRSQSGPSLITPNPPAPPNSPNGIIAKTVAKSVKSVIEPVKVEASGGKIKIEVSGLTAELKKGDLNASIGASWTGTLTLEADAGSFHFSGEVSTNRWSVSLSYPDDTVVPDLSKVGETFAKAEEGVRNVIRSASTFRNLRDVHKVKEAVTPHMKPVKEAIEAVRNISKTSGKRVSAGVTLGSPEQKPGETGMPKGYEVTLNVTIRF